MNIRERLATVEEIMRDILGCFIRAESGWWQHKGSDGWIDVGEDLNDYLTEAEDYTK